MSFPFEKVKEVTTCDVCNNVVVIPPGRYYRGFAMHKACYHKQRQIDYSEEIKEPQLDTIEEEIEDLLENMGPMSDG